PSIWDDTTDTFIAGNPNISFTAPTVPGTYPYQVKWGDSESCAPDKQNNPVTDCLNGADAFNITLIVTASSNHAPVAVNDSYSTDEDTTLTVSAPGVLGNDADADGDGLTASWVFGPAHGTLTFNADGSFTYTPAANYNGSDSFTYKANDGKA